MDTPDDPRRAALETAAHRLPAAADVDGLTVDPDHLDDLVAGLRAGTWADATLDAYRADLEHFAAWCQAAGRPALPADPDTVAGYVAALATATDDGEGEDDGGEEAGPRFAVATIERRVAAIATLHREAGVDPVPTRTDTVRRVMAGVRRHGQPARQARPLLTADIRTIVGALPDGPKGARDAALILVGYAGALRRSELVAIDVDHLTPVDEGLDLLIPASKGDQEHAGAVVAIPYGSDPTTCPVRTLDRWLNLAHIDAGPVFRPVDRHGRIAATRLTPRSVPRILTTAAETAGIEPDRISGHSLRRGHATQAARTGTPERHIMRQGRWSDARTVRRYIEDGTRWDETSATHLGL